MYLIYAGSFLTIAAPGAENNRAGCFVDRNLSATRVSCPYGDSEVVGLYLRKVISHDLFWQEDSGVELDPVDDPRLPLISRGWVYQERALSRRILHFTRDELVWECMQKSICECGASSTSARSVKRDMSSPLVARNLTADRLNAKWRASVQDYSSKELTYETDRLPALSGLAKSFGQQKFGIDYLAGLRRDGFELDLLLHVAEQAQPDINNHKRLPSWSWASVNDKVVFYSLWYPSKEWKIAIEVSRAACELLGSDSTGEVQAGKITFRGIAEPVKSMKPHYDQGRIKIIVTPFEEVPDYIESYIVTLDKSPSENFEVDIYWDTRERIYKGPQSLKVAETQRIRQCSYGSVPTGGDGNLEAIVL